MARSFQSLPAETHTRGKIYIRHGLQYLSTISASTVFGTTKMKQPSIGWKKYSTASNMYRTHTYKHKSKNDKSQLKKQLLLKTVKEFVIFFGDTRCPLPIRFGIFVEIAGVTVVADFGDDRRLDKRIKCQQWISTHQRQDVMSIFLFIFTLSFR